MVPTQCKAKVGKPLKETKGSTYGLQWNYADTAARIEENGKAVSCIDGGKKKKLMNPLFLFSKAHNVAKL